MNPSISAALLHGDGSVLCRRCAQALGVDDVAVTLREAPGSHRTLWGSSERVRRVLSWERSLDEGPCLDVVRGTTGFDPYGALSARWPQLWREAAREGVGSAAAVPVEVAGVGIGALGLYAAGDGVVDARVASLAGELAPVVADAVTRALGRLQDGLLPAEEELVPQAVGMVAVQRSLDVEGAGSTLRQLAREEGRLLLDVAAEIVARTRSLRLDGGQVAEST